MGIKDLRTSERLCIGNRMYELMSKLFPICRSITGNGFRDTLNLIKEHIELEVNEIPTGTKVFDWTIPKEWNIKDAYIKNTKGERIIDFQKSNLHVVSYSTPIKRTMPLRELKEHLYTLPDYPDWIPYRTSYYKEDWGFCLSHNQYVELTDQEYDVCIDSSLVNGHLTYGEYYLKGQSEEEFLLSCHACHPSMCNDNLSSIVLTTFLARHLSKSITRFSYRFLFIPGTIGSITWLARNEKNACRIKHGLVVACVGDSGRFTYKRSRQRIAEVDQGVIHALKESGEDYEITDFFPYGYDERQYCSPGFNLPVGCLMRTPHGRYAEYHTSADNLDFVKQEELERSFYMYLNLISLLEANKKYINNNPKCEPQLGKRRLYGLLGGGNETAASQMAMLWVLNFSDGRNDLVAISEKSGIPFEMISRTADLLLQQGLLKQAEPGETIG